MMMQACLTFGPYGERAEADGHQDPAFWMGELVRAESCGSSADYQCAGLQSGLLHDDALSGASSGERSGVGWLGGRPDHGDARVQPARLVFAGRNTRRSPGLSGGYHRWLSDPLRRICTTGLGRATARLTAGGLPNRVRRRPFYALCPGLSGRGMSASGPATTGICVAQSGQRGRHAAGSAARLMADALQLRTHGLGVWWRVSTADRVAVALSAASPCSGFSPSRENLATVAHHSSQWRLFMLYDLLGRLWRAVSS